MPTLFMKLVHEDKVLRPQALRVLRLGEETVGYSLDIGLNYYRGLPLSAVEKLELSVDGQAVPEHLMLFEFNEKLFQIDHLAQAWTEFWSIKKDLRLKVFNGGLAQGEHEVALRLELRNVSMRFGPGVYGMIDGSATRTLTLCKEDDK